MNNISDVNTRTKDIFKYLSEVLDIGESGISVIRDSLAVIHSTSPIEGAQVFSRLETVNVCSDNLAYLLFMIDSERLRLLKEYNSKRDPYYVSLVRSNRPSDKAISSEIRLQNKDISLLEDKINIIENAKLYLSHIEKGLNEYSRILRDKLNYCK